jgi:MTH538 TIR-like domain (DUF1863)
MNWNEIKSFEPPMNPWEILLKAQTRKVRRVFFAYHYKADVQRAQVVSKSWITKPDRESAGFLNNLEFEKKQRQDKELLKQFLSDAMKGCSVTAVLIGTETARRPWVRYELIRSFQQGRGLLGIYVHNINDFNGKTAEQGHNPFGSIAYSVAAGRVSWYEYTIYGWQPYTEVPTVAAGDLPYPLREGDYNLFSALFPVYWWYGGDGYTNLGAWVDAAARAAGR